MNYIIKSYHTESPMILTISMTVTMTHCNYTKKYASNSLVSAIQSLCTEPACGSANRYVPGHQNACTVLRNKTRGPLWKEKCRHRAAVQCAQSQIQTFCKSLSQ